ncbi:MAG: diguanylate cyclase [Cyanosarcina radialis HA8281-LM2]|jgi:diguanylate cyclase (GGDEF)-like protein|nr:diguanylate cyclase [Cyanosarcina radialis HA8281-LM2]
MDINRQQRRLFISLVSLLTFAFIGTISLSYFVARNAIRKNIIEKELPLTGDSIYSEIQRDLIKPVFVSDQMAHNTFLLDWIAKGEQDPDAIVRYLSEIQQRYNALTSFYVSDRTRRYFTGKTITKTISETDEDDRWFFRVRAMKEPYEINVEADAQNNNRLTAFINFRVVDSAGRFLGATGVGLASDSIFKLVEEYKHKFNRDITFFDLAGNSTVYDPNSNSPTVRLSERPGIKVLTSEILNGSPIPVNLSYKSATDDSLVHVNSRFVPELKWYLVVSQDEKEAVSPLNHILLVNLGIGSLATLGALVLAIWLVSRHQQRLVRVAVTDKLTGVANRSSADTKFSQVREEAKASGETFSVLVIDCDRFKQVNDEYGHLVGDLVIAEIARSIRQNIRSSDYLARWGGEEFLVLLPNANCAGAMRRAEALRVAVENHVFTASDVSLKKTVSIGVAEWDRTESNEALFDRADRALLESKQSGRNRVTAATTAAEYV